MRYFFNHLQPPGGGQRTPVPLLKFCVTPPLPPPISVTLFSRLDIKTTHTNLG